MTHGILGLLVVCAVLVLAIYYYLTANYDYWRGKGVAGPRPSVPFGNVKDVMFGKLSIGDYLHKEYKNYKDEPMFGIFTRRRPVLIIKDPEYIRNILIKDFVCFTDRGMELYEKIEPLSRHLFNLEPARWRPLRMKLSPIFTSGKLKEMFYLLKECADHLGDFLDGHVKKNPVIEVRELAAKFTTDVIGVYAFGLEMKALAEEESQFRKMGRKFFETNLKRFIRFRIRESVPWLYRLLKPIVYDHEMNDFFIGTMMQTMEYREKYNIKRNDLVNLLIEMKKNPGKVGDFEITDTLITAQAFVFFVAGFETSSLTISNALYELALNHTIQDKLRNEIKGELEKTEGELKYESIKNMKYMQKVFCETLRKYPLNATLMRSAMESYTFSGSKVTIPEGMKVWIPVYAIHRDPHIYPDPDTFDPERFDQESIKTRHPSFYLPFGDGPRNCIGARFAHYQFKVALLKVLKNYKLTVCDETCIPYVNNPRSFLLSPMGGIKLKFTKIQ